jgi:hypothetical protein
MSDTPRRVHPDNVRAVRLGHGANCSSVGSVIDTLFASAVVGGAVFAAVAAALGREDVVVVGSAESKESKAKEPEGQTKAAAEEDAP